MRYIIQCRQMEKVGLHLTKRIGIVIQCRDGSTRYKEKSVRPFFEGKSILEIIVEKFQIFDYPIIVATSKNSLRTMVLCNMMNIPYYIGSEANVLERLVKAAHEYKLDGILRVCADNPFIDLGLMYPVLTWGETMDYDYVAFDNCMQRHEGFFLEYISMNALACAHLKVSTNYDREHVTPYIIRNEKMLFKQKILPIPPILNKVFIRLTVDTEDDFKTAKDIYEKIYRRGYCCWHRVLEYIQEHPEIEKDMLRGMRLNKK